MSEANMIISDHFKENADRANAWLKTNAPDYVREVVEEMGGIAILFGNKAIEADNQFIELSNKYCELSQLFCEQADKMIDSHRVRWYHWILPPYGLFKLYLWNSVFRDFAKENEHQTKG